MADLYVSASGSNTAPYDTWAKAATALATAVGAAAAGDRIFLDAAYSETGTTALSLTFPGTVTNPVQLLAVANTGSAPVSADLSPKSAVVQRTGGSGGITITGSLYCYGVVFDAGGALSFNSTNDRKVFEECWFKHGGTGAITAGSTAGGTTSGILRWINTDLTCANTSAGILTRGNIAFEWLGGTLTNIVSNLFGLGGFTIAQTRMLARNVDLSVMGAARFLVNVAFFGNTMAPIAFERCKLSASLGGVINGNIASDTGNGVTVDLIACDSGNTYREEHYRWAGNWKDETVVVRSGGASDGTTAKSHKLSSNANATPVIPLVGPDLIVWIDGTGSKTLTVELLTDGVTLKDADFGLDVEYMGDATSPLGTMMTTRADVLAAGTSLPTSTETWTTTGLTSPVRQKATATITVNQKGFVRVRPILAKASTAVYVDPLIAVT